MSKPINYRFGWFELCVSAGLLWWASGNTVAVICAIGFIAVWWWNAERMQKAAEKERAIEQAEEEFATFDPEIMALDAQYDALSQGYYDGANEEAQRILNARKHRVMVLLNERGLLK
jgi:hypothetical protein